MHFADFLSNRGWKLQLGRSAMASSGAGSSAGRSVVSETTSSLCRAAKKRALPDSDGEEDPPAYPDPRNLQLVPYEKNIHMRGLVFIYKVDVYSGVAFGQALHLGRHKHYHVALRFTTTRSAAGYNLSPNYMYSVKVKVERPNIIDVRISLHTVQTEPHNTCGVLLEWVPVAHLGQILDMISRMHFEDVLATRGCKLQLGRSSQETQTICAMSSSGAGSSADRLVESSTSSLCRAAEKRALPDSDSDDPAPYPCPMSRSST